MMGQELFEHPLRQYDRYRLTPCTAATAIIGDPERFVDAEPDDAQAAAMQRILEANPESVLTYDEDGEMWIVGAEDDINRMFADREEFVEALENGIDPGA